VVQGLNKVIWDATTSYHGGRTNANTVAGKIAWNSRPNQDFSDPSGEDSAG